MVWDWFSFVGLLFYHTTEVSKVDLQGVSHPREWVILCGFLIIEIDHLEIVLPKVLQTLTNPKELLVKLNNIARNVALPWGFILDQSPKYLRLSFEHKIVNTIIINDPGFNLGHLQLSTVISFSKCIKQTWKSFQNRSKQRISLFPYSNTVFDDL